MGGNFLTIQIQNKTIIVSMASKLYCGQTGRQVLSGNNVSESLKGEDGLK